MTAIPASETSALPPLPAEFGRVRVLVADDSRTNRMVLGGMLGAIGCDVALAADGIEAVESFEASPPDLVLLDVMMPHMDGYEAARRMRALMAERYVPIIFLTALSEVDDVARCYEAGADSCFSKPYSPVVLHAKIRSCLELRRLYEAMRLQRDQLAQHEARLAQEFEETHRVLAHISAARVSEAENVRTLIMPMAVVNGDVILTAWGPGGGQQVLVGDFTGHGVPAAVGAVVVTEVFHAMSGRGFSGGEILAELNRKLGRMLPPGRFLAVAFIEVDRELRGATVWNAGLPDLLVVSADGGVRRCPSTAVPLAVLREEDPALDPTHVRLERGDRIYAFTDGVTELRGPAGDLFGIERVIECLRTVQGEDAVGALLAAQSAFRAADEAHDDVSLVEIRCDPTLIELRAHEETPTGPEDLPASWQATLELGAEALRRIEPVPMLVQLMRDVQGPRADRGRVFTVMAELYSNALEHGLLGLDSAMKADSEGFTAYYRERTERLARLEGVRLCLGVGCRMEAGRAEVVVRVAHDGAGFDHEAVLARAGDAAHGRGIRLIRALSERLVYSDGGRVAEATCRW